MIFGSGVCFCFGMGVFFFAAVYYLWVRAGVTEWLG